MAAKSCDINTKNKLRLKSTLYAAGIRSDGMMLFFSPDEVVHLDFSHLLHRKIIELLDGTRTVKSVYRKLLDDGVEVTEAELVDYLEKLSEARLLEEKPWDLPDPDLERYDRQIRFFAAEDPKGLEFGIEVQRKLMVSKVTLIGLGGLGSHVLALLAGMGVGNIQVVDHDVVEISNLGRQTIYANRDLGRSKVQAALEYARARNPKIRIDGIEKNLASKEDIISLVSSSDLVVFLADSPRHLVFKWMNEACFATGVPTLFSMGVTLNMVKAGPLVIPGKTACFACALPDIGLDFEHPLAVRHNAYAVHGVVAPYVMAAASLLSMETLRYLGGLKDLPLKGRLMSMDMSTFETRVVEVEPRPGCPVCGY